jgi:hypothetical protein
MIRCPSGPHACTVAEPSQQEMSVKATARFSVLLFVMMSLAKKDAQLLCLQRVYNQGTNYSGEWNTAVV